MNEVKYKDKYLLTEYNLNVDLFEKYDLKVEDVFPIRNVFQVHTVSGDMILKKIDYSLEELKFINEALKYIKKNFLRVVDFQKSKTGEIYVKLENQVYCFMDFIDGRECEFNNPIDISIASRGLGELHRASEGFKYDMPSKNNCGKIVNNFKRRLEEMKFFNSIVNKFEHKNEFDEIFLCHIEYYLKEIQGSIDNLVASDYNKLCNEEDKVVLCHHDLAHHNILIKNDLAYFVDFDYALIDIKVHDLCNFINKAIKNSAYDTSKVELIITEYCNNNTLDHRELEVLYSLLSFPHDFYEVARDYYTRRKNWDEETFICKLKKKLNFKEDNIEFLQQYKKIFL